MARIALEHVDKVYANGFVAARDLSLEVADGEDGLAHWAKFPGPTSWAYFAATNFMCT